MSLSATTPSVELTISDFTATILKHVDDALHAHGSKNYVERIDFVDIMLDIRKLATHILHATVDR